MLAHPISLMKINYHTKFQLSNLCLTTRARNHPYSEFRSLDRFVGPSRESTNLGKKLPVSYMFESHVLPWA